MVKIVYVFDKINDEINSIFLAGPTYRVTNSAPISCREENSWREEAIKILEAQGYDGTVYCPEWKDNKKPADWTYSRQIDWENECLNKSKVILFWIPREKQSLPGLTTNIEFGEWMKSGKIVVGAPTHAENIRYIHEKCSRYAIAWTETLEKCVENALNKLKELKDETSHIWLTADSHFGQQRTLELSKRPFASVEEMDWAMIKGWNESVGENDIVYHLGDVGNPSCLKHLKGKQILLCAGNYDKPDIISEMLKDKRVTVIPSNTEIKINDYRFHLIHEPENGIGIDNFFLFGHIHNLQMVKKNGLNVGVDCHQFKPINEKTILFYRNAILNHYDENVFMPVIKKEESI
jgi:calcineurin-like phosphoesterase family protein